MEEPKHSSGFPLRPPTEEGDRSKSEPTRDRGGSRKSITMASASRYLTDKRYSVRRPLVSDHTSILKKTETEKDVSRNERNQKHTDVSALIPVELTLESCNCSPTDISSSLPSGEDLRSPLGELRASVLLKQHTHESPFIVRRSAQQSLTSSILEAQRLNTPLRPPLSSTVLYPSYTPRSGYSGYSRTGLTGRGGQNKPCFFEGPSKGRKLSVHQLNYRACAIPKSSPPSADRCSRDWDPNQEYQALLDYTYPLRPEQEPSEWNSSAFQPKSHLHDSGIEVDHLCSPNSLSGLSFSGSETEQTREKSAFSGAQRSHDQQVPTDFSKGLLSRIQVSQSDPMGLCVDSLHNRESMTDSRSHQHQPPSSCPTFVRSTSVLPWCRDAGGAVDDEFWSLPLELEELKLLSRQVRVVTTKLRRPVDSSCGSLGPLSSSSHSSISVPVVQKSKGPGNSETGRKKPGHLSQIADHRESESLRRRVVELAEPNDEACVQDVSVLAEQLCIFNSPCSQRSSQENSKQSDSLLQHIQMFCSQLEKLIQQLYSLSEKMELLAAPSVDGVKSPVAEYECFERDVSSHQPLTSSVLHTGQLLLNCINTTSPFLRDTLLMIEKQSEAIGSHKAVSSSMRHDPQTAGARP